MLDYFFDVVCVEGCYNWVVGLYCLEGYGIFGIMNFIDDDVVWF